MLGQRYPAVILRDIIAGLANLVGPHKGWAAGWGCPTSPEQDLLYTCSKFYAVVHAHVSIF